MNRITDACENITLPQLRLRAVLSIEGDDVVQNTERAAEISAPSAPVLLLTEQEEQIKKR